MKDSDFRNEWETVKPDDPDNYDVGCVPVLNRAAELVAEMDHP